jgi:hypothetical protein
MSYLPNPPRAWSRVENNINCTDPLVPPLGKYNVFIPLTNQTVVPGVANYQAKVLYKGNILQFKNNSSNLSKKQQYSQIAKGFGSSRKKSYATQSTTYTNPNNSSLYRVNSVSIPMQNQIPGSIGNPAGPYQTTIQNPFDCNTDTIEEGGALICGTLADPCSNTLLKQGRVQQCASITSSDVPGFGVPGITQELCWNNKLSVFIPRQRRTMSNSGNKWPTNYKAFVSATTPIPPILDSGDITSTSVTLSWSFQNNLCIPISQFFIYQNGSIIKRVSFQQTVTVIDNLSPNIYSFYITSVSNNIQSSPSNTVVITVG